MFKPLARLLDVILFRKKPAKDPTVELVNTHPTIEIRRTFGVHHILAARLEQNKETEGGNSKIEA